MREFDRFGLAICVTILLFTILWLVFDNRRCLNYHYEDGHLCGVADFNTGTYTCQKWVCDEWASK